MSAVNPFGSSADQIVPRSLALARPVEESFGYARDDEHAGDPVSLATGNLTGSWGDLVGPPGSWGLNWVRSYNSRDTSVGVMGTGWSTVLDVSLVLVAAVTFS